MINGHIQCQIIHAICFLCFLLYLCMYRPCNPSVLTFLFSCNTSFIFTYFAIKLFLVLFIILFFSIFCLVSGKTQGNEGGREKDQKSIKLYISCMLSSLRTLLCFKLYEVIKKNNKLQSFFFSFLCSQTFTQLRIHSSQDCNVVISISLMQFRYFLTKRMMNDNDDKR